MNFVYKDGSVFIQTFQQQMNETKEKWMFLKTNVYRFHWK